MGPERALRGSECELVVSRVLPVILGVEGWKGSRMFLKVVVV
jgi:hypothetical protein